MIKDIIVAESWHLCDIGHTKFIVRGYCGEFKNTDTEWPSEQIDEISNYLRKCILPKEMNCQLRGLDKLDQWKASEFRSFFLYASIVVFKLHLSAPFYQHYLRYYCAISLCYVENQSEDNLNFAQMMIKKYLEEFKTKYGEKHMTSNLHNLIHLVDDVKRFGPLQTISAYPFENYLSNLKRIARGKVNIVPRIVRQLNQKNNNIGINRKIVQNVGEPFGLIQNMPENELDYSDLIYSTDEMKYYNNFQSKDYVLHGCFACKETCPNKWILTMRNEIIEIQYFIEKSKTKVYIRGKPMSHLEDFFEWPLKSSQLNVFSSNGNKGRPVNVELKDIKAKMVKMNSGNHIVFIPLMHTIDE